MIVMDSPDGACLPKPCTSASVRDMDVTADDEPCTQPMPEDEQEFPDSQESIMDIDHSQVFGYLLPLKPAGPMIPLDKDIFTVGRSVNTSYRIGSGGVKNFDAISKVHFIIRKEAGGVIMLQDMSSNGTFVNGSKVGKNKKAMLVHNDMIGLALGKVKNFVYMSTNKDYLKMYPEELRKKYTVSRELGKGACGTVVLGIRRDDHSQVAIKVINKKHVTMVQPSAKVHNVMNEVELLKLIDHPCIIRLEDVIETETELFIILELADGGELFEKIIEKSRLQEEEAKLHFYQIVSAIEYLHSKNIAHRDLKPENILLCKDDDLNPIIKVTDLGLSKFVDVHTHLKTFCGTPQYLAPEVLFSRVRGDGSYDLKVDMWSLGVILYILLCGCPPFNPERTDKPLIRQVTEGDFSFPTRLWSKISLPAVDLVKKLMTVDPKERLSATATLEHPWLKDEAIVLKAQKLMDTQRKIPIREPSVSCLKGILPDEWEINGGVSNGMTKKSDESTFKRPLEEMSPIVSSCKRVRLNKE